MGGPVFWDSSTAGPLVYNWAEDDVLKSYKVSWGRLATPAYAQGGVVSAGHPGGSLTVSANGAAQGTGIVWASMPTSQDGDPRPRGWHAPRIRRRDAAGDLDERTERHPRSHWNADEVRSAGRRQRQGLHARITTGRWRCTASCRRRWLISACAVSPSALAIAPGAVRHVRSDGQRRGRFRGKRCAQRVRAAAGHDHLLRSIVDHRGRHFIDGGLCRPMWLKARTPSLLRARAGAWSAQRRCGLPPRRSARSG